MNSGQTEFTFLWFIENYSYCVLKNGEQLLSPEFTPDGLKHTAWALALYPRGDSKEDKGYISLFLYRADDNAYKIPMKFQLSILAADGSSISSLDCEYAFRRGRLYGTSQFKQIDEMQKHRNEKYLPQDTLRLSCKIWRGEGNLEQVTQVSARTRIRIQEISFLHAVESFSTLEPDQKKTIEHQLPTANEGWVISSSVYFKRMLGKEKIMIEIQSSDASQILIKCKLSLLDASGIEIKCGGADNRHSITKLNIQKLSLSLPREDILKGRSKYLPDDKMSLLCECVFSSGVEPGCIERILHEIPSVALNQAQGNNQNKHLDNPIENLSEYPDALDILETIYRNHFLTDVEIKTKTNSFPAHKMWLCARSPVFNAMLTSDMKEKSTNIIPGDDLDDETVQQLLLFLYTDNLEKLRWESAINLYYAGDKFDIGKLKEICSSFLIDNITTSCASELLLLADTHNDSDLKTAVEDFICKHEEQVFGSEEWEKLIEINPELVSKTMLHRYKRKREVS